MVNVLSVIGWAAGWVAAGVFYVKLQKNNKAMETSATALTEAQTAINAAGEAAKNANDMAQYCLQNFAPLVAVLAAWPPGEAGPPQAMRDEARRALDGAKTVGVTISVQAQVMDAATAKLLATHGAIKVH